MGAFRNPDYLDVDLGRPCRAHRDLILGIKAASTGTPRGGARYPADAEGRASWRPRRPPADEHISTSPPSIHEVAEFLRPGDILTTASRAGTWHHRPDGGKVDPQIKALREAGARFDIGTAPARSATRSPRQCSIRASRPMSSPATLPDAIQGPAFDLPTTLSVHNLGMPLADVIACATLNAAGQSPRRRGHAVGRGRRPISPCSGWKSEFAFQDVFMSSAWAASCWSMR